MTLISCNNSRLRDKGQNETPTALKDNNSSYEIVSGRGYDDLVEGLYKELAEKNPDLMELETQIGKLADSKGDSLNQFDKFNSQNQRYYVAADSHTGQIKDTVLQEKMKQLIQTSLTKYGTLISRHTEILKSIDKKAVSLNDLHQILKITRTLPIIEKYQIDNLPSTKPLENYFQQMNKTVQYADSLTKK